MNFSERLRFYREQAKLSQKELAEKVGVTFAAYNKYETAGYEPKIDIIIKLAQSLGIDANTLLGFSKSDNLQYVITMLRQAGIDVLSTINQDGDTLIVYDSEDGTRSNACLLSRALVIIEKCQLEVNKATTSLLNIRIQNEFFNNHFLSLTEEQETAMKKFSDNHGKDFMEILKEISKLPQKEQDEIIKRAFSKTENTTLK